MFPLEHSFCFVANGNYTKVMSLFQPVSVILDLDPTPYQNPFDKNQQLWK